MVGLFSRFSVSRSGHRRAQSALDGRVEVSPLFFSVAYQQKEVPPTSEDTDATTAAGVTLAAAHGIEVAVEFKPLEHPTEPLDNDRPIQCPLPEPSILNDGRIWKEQVSAGVRRRAEIPIGGAHMESEAVGAKPRPPSRRLILPSISAPEHSILKLLEECNSSGI